MFILCNFCILKRGIDIIKIINMYRKIISLNEFIFIFLYFIMYYIFLYMILEIILSIVINKYNLYNKILFKVYRI